jgi:hypothetical protein
MLTKGMRKYVLSEDKSGYDKGTQNTYNYRLRIDIKEAIEDLTLILQKLPESELENLFNDGTLAGFFEALFKIGITPHGNQTYAQRKCSKEIKSKRQRLFKLSKSVLRNIGNGKFVSAILPESSKHHICIIGGEKTNLSEIFDTEIIE